MKRCLIPLLLFLMISPAILAQVINLKGRWKFHIGDDASWAAPDYNDANWQSIRVPSTWEDEGFNGYDGFAWYRIKFDGRRLEQNEVYYINLGYIDDVDEVYLNGRFIGFSGQCPPKFKTAFNNERKYVLPTEVIDFNGSNTIAVRVFDSIHRGGIVDGDIGIFSLAENRRLLIDLQGIWSFAPSRRGGPVEDDDDWNNIMVPAPWESQGYSRYDGFGWYKRTFTVPSNFTTDQLVLILGKIDDFDQVYINGKLIGSTNDRRPYGSSHSFEVTRVYEIPSQLLKRPGTNTIEILVEDMGNVGGIYEGPVGITTKSNYEKYFR